MANIVKAPLSSLLCYPKQGKVYVFIDGRYQGIIPSKGIKIDERTFDKRLYDLVHYVGKSFTICYAKKQNVPIYKNGDRIHIKSLNGIYTIRNVITSGILEIGCKRWDYEKRTEIIPAEEVQCFAGGRNRIR